MLMVFCGLAGFPLSWVIFFLTLSTLWKEMGMVEKEGSLGVLDSDQFFFFFFSPTAQMI